MSNVVNYLPGSQFIMSKHLTTHDILKFTRQINLQDNHTTADIYRTDHIKLPTTQNTITTDIQSLITAEQTQDRDQD